MARMDLLMRRPALFCASFFLGVLSTKSGFHKPDELWYSDGLYRLEPIPEALSVLGLMRW